MEKLSESRAGSRNAFAFLDMLACAEGISSSPATARDGYDVIVTGIDRKPEVFKDFSDHPFARGRRSKVINSRGLTSTLLAAISRCSRIGRTTGLSSLFRISAQSARTCWPCSTFVNAGHCQMFMPDGSRRRSRSAGISGPACRVQGMGSVSIGLTI